MIQPTLNLATTRRGKPGTAVACLARRPYIDIEKVRAAGGGQGRERCESETLCSIHHCCFQRHYLCHHAANTHCQFDLKETGGWRTVGAARWLERETECARVTVRGRRRVAGGGGGGGGGHLLHSGDREPPPVELRRLSESMAGPGACRSTKKTNFTDSRRSLILLPFLTRRCNLLILYLRRHDKERSR